MSVWQFVKRITAAAVTGVGDMVEAVRTVFVGNPDLRRRVAFSIAMIALSAKMAKADGVVTQDEIRAFQQIFEIPASERHNVARLYDLAKQDVAGLEAYASAAWRPVRIGQVRTAPSWKTFSTACSTSPRPTACCTSGRAASRRAGRRDLPHRGGPLSSILARHAHLGEAIPGLCSASSADSPFDEVKRRYRKLVAANHPDKLVARGLPEEFIKIATTRIAAINAAREMIEREVLSRAMSGSRPTISARRSACRPISARASAPRGPTSSSSTTPA